MDLQHLRTFLAVARSGGVTRAAEVLHLSQPAVSGQLRSLQEELGLELFQRTGRGMVLSTAGEVLAPFAERVLAAQAELVAEAAALSGQTAGRVRVGISGHAGTLHLPELLRRAAEALPAVAVELCHGAPGAVEADVAVGRLDLGFVVGAVSSPELIQDQLGKATVYVAIPAGWEAQVRATGWDRVGELPWVVGAEDSFCGAVARQRAAGSGRVIEVDHPSAALELVTAGVCVGVLHEEDALPAEAAGTVVLWREQPIAAPVWLVRRRGAPARTAAERIAELAKILWLE